MVDRRLAASRPLQRRDDVGTHLKHVAASAQEEGWWER
jgi:hypothetical protein